MSRITGKSNWHKQKGRDAGIGSGSKLRRYNWAKKAIRRNAPGTGRQSYTRHVERRLKNGFREGTKAKAVKRQATA